MKRGRPCKTRPTRFEDLNQNSSIRDIAAATGTSRKFIERALALASIPEDEFEAALADGATAHNLELLARSRAGKVTEYERKCPHCGGLLRIESAS